MTDTIPKAFVYDGEVYIRAVPVKSLFNSNLVHNVVTRGDVFALRIRTGELTIVPGKSQVSPVLVSYTVTKPK